MFLRFLSPLSGCLLLLRSGQLYKVLLCTYICIDNGNNEPRALLYGDCLDGGFDCTHLISRDFLLK